MQEFLQTDAGAMTLDDFVDNEKALDRELASKIGDIGKSADPEGGARTSFCEHVELGVGVLWLEVGAKVCLFWGEPAMHHSSRY